ncbi:hypothetical protein LAZ67_X002356 [Cordylochernes scorpioides]|uniref:Copia protein n=1 Tax=Cordylochernes scorpioides TaxID=51811 RepID=A0ABY6LTR7_9ARAC|nr:hypothetical protein LAZ67_X002356 [Cordylochernes scorpioides]
MTLMKTGQMNRKTKHIDVRYHFLKDQIRENVDDQFCPTQDQVADILTKPLPKETFEKHRSSLLQMMGVIVVQKPIFVLPQIRAFLVDCFAQIAHNLQVIFLIDHSSLWQELMMHHAPAIEKTVSKTFTFDRTWRAFSVLVCAAASIEMIELWFPHHNHKLTLRHQL